MTGINTPDGDDMLDAFDKAAPFIDAGWRRESGIRPSSMMALRYCALMSAGDAEARAEARRLGNVWLQTARQRYRDGYYANPFGAPVRREARQ